MSVSDVLRFLRCRRQRYIYVATPVTELQLTAPSSRLSRNFNPKFIFMLDVLGHARKECRPLFRQFQAGVASYCVFKVNAVLVLT